MKRSLPVTTRVAKKLAILLAVFTALPLLAGAADCWQRATVRVEWRAWVDGDLVLLDTGDPRFERVGLNATVDDTRQWLEYRTPGYQGLTAGARASWSAAPRRICAGDRFDVDFDLVNLAVNSSSSNVFASVSSRLGTAYGNCGSGRLTLGFNVPHTSRARECRFIGGQQVGESTGTLTTRVSIADLTADLFYDYLPERGGLPTLDGGNDETTPAPPRENTSGAPSAPGERKAGDDSVAAIARVIDEMLNRTRWVVNVPPAEELSHDMNTMLDALGPPDAFSRTAYQAMSGEIVYTEWWHFADAASTLAFMDGEFFRSQNVVSRHTRPEPTRYLPHQFAMGESRAALVERLGVTLRRVDAVETFVADYHGGPVEVWAAEGLLLGFLDDRLVYVDAFAISQRGHP